MAYEWKGGGWAWFPGRALHQSGVSESHFLPQVGAEPAFFLIAWQQEHPLVTENSTTTDKGETADYASVGWPLYPSRELASSLKVLLCNFTELIQLDLCCYYCSFLRGGGEYVEIREELDFFFGHKYWSYFS